MVNPKNTSRAQNDASDYEPTVTMTVGTIGTTNAIGVTCPYYLRNDSYDDARSGGYFTIGN